MFIIKIEVVMYSTFYSHVSVVNVNIDGERHLISPSNRLLLDAVSIK